MRAALVLAAALVVSLVFPAGVGAAVPDARLTVSAATVAPAAPVVGEPVTVTVTVANSLASASAVDVRQVELLAGDRTLDEAFELGSLSPGDALTVPLVTTFDAADARTLSVRVVALDADDERVELRRPVPVVVADAPPLVEVSVADPAVDSPSTVAVRVANPTPTAVRNVVVALADPPGEATVDRRTLPLVVAGGVETVELEWVPGTAGDATVPVRVSYLTAAGTPGAVSLAPTVTVAPFRDDVGLAVAPASAAASAPNAVDVGDVAGDVGGLLAGGGLLDGGDAEGPPDPTRVEVVVTNFGSVRVDDAVLTPVAGEETLPRVRLDGPLAPGASTTVAVDLAPVRTDATVEFRLSYRAGVREGAASVAYDWRPPLGEVRVTDVDVVVADGVATVEGNVANVGRATLSGVVVDVGPADGVRPVPPSGSYFVGTVGGSDFAPFELTAAVPAAGDGDGDAPASVPVRVAYRVDGERFETTTVVEVPPAESTAGRSFAPAAIAIGLVAVGVVALAYGVRGRVRVRLPFAPRVGDDATASDEPRGAARERAR